MSKVCVQLQFSMVLKSTPGNTYDCDTPRPRLSSLAHASLYPYCTLPQNRYLAINVGFIALYGLLPCSVGCLLACIWCSRERWAQTKIS